MNILHLKYAVEVANTGSINKAAENLYMNQPNLSRAIKELEDSLGITIFERTTRGMRLTPDGEEFLGYAKKILSQIDAVENLYKKEREEKLRFSISVPRASYISDAFAQFVKKIDKSKSCEIFYKETNSMRAIDNILRADYKLGIIRYSASYDKQFKKSLEEKRLSYEMISEFSYVLIMNKNHPLANKPDIHFSDLTPYTEIAHADPYVPSMPFAAVKKEELPDDARKRIFVFERASQFDILSSDIDTFMWVSPIPQPLLDRYGLVRRGCGDNNKIYKDILVYRKDYTLSPLDNAFITELCASKRKYI